LGIPRIHLASLVLSNDLRIKLQAIMPTPAQTYASLTAPPEGAVRAVLRAHPASRLHALDISKQGSRW
jgi:hypothetical protein